MHPNGWNSKPLAQLLDKIIDYRGQSVPKSSSGIPLITARNVREGYLDFSNQEYVDESKFEEWMSRGTPKKGDILFTTEAPLGKACRYPSEGVYAIGQRTVTLRTNKKLDSEFLLYTILSERGQLLIDLRSSGSTAKGIKSTELKKVKITYPEDLQEQRKIAKILSTWDKAIATTERLIATSQQQKKALMQQLLTGKKRLVNPDTGMVFEGNWENIKVANFGKVVTGNTPPKDDASNYGTDISWATAEDFTGKYVGNTKKKLTKSGASKARIVPAGSVLVTCIASIGKNAIANEELTTNQQINAVIVNNKHCNEFFYYQIEFNKHKLLAWAGTTAVPILNKSSFEKIHLIAPKKQEQQKIALVLTYVDKEIELLEAKLTHLKEEKKALMQQLLTGKRRVKMDKVEEVIC